MAWIYVLIDGGGRQKAMDVGIESVDETNT